MQKAIPVHPLSSRFFPIYRADSSLNISTPITLWADARLVLFGHALLEKLVYPRKPITAHVYREQFAIDPVANLDARLAADLTAAKLAGKPFTPLPVLGVPGWWPQNEPVGEHFSFYDDSLVFRPRR